MKERNSSFKVKHCASHLSSLLLITQRVSDGFKKLNSRSHFRWNIYNSRFIPIRHEANESGFETQALWSCTSISWVFLSQWKIHAKTYSRPQQGDILIIARNETFFYSKWSFCRSCWNTFDTGAWTLTTANSKLALTVLLKSSSTKWVCDIRSQQLKSFFHQKSDETHYAVRLFLVYYALICIFNILDYWFSCSSPSW